MDVEPLLYIEASAQWGPARIHRYEKKMSDHSSNIINSVTAVKTTYILALRDKEIWRLCRQASLKNLFSGTHKRKNTFYKNLDALRLRCYPVAGFTNTCFS